MVDQRASEQPEPQRCAALLLAVAAATPLGFFGPLLFLERVAPTFVEYPGDRSYLLAFGLPLLPGALLVLRGSTRGWGAALLLGAAVGLAILLTWLWLVLSSTS